MHSLYLPEPDAFIRWHSLPGNGRPVVYLPGIGFPSVSNFLPVASDPVLQGRGAVMIDFLGTGSSEHPAAFDHTLSAHSACVAAVLDGLGLTHCPVVGYSMGGSIAAALAGARPDLVSRLLVAEANLLPGGGAGSRYIASFDIADFKAEGLPGILTERRSGAVLGNTVDAFVAGAWPRVQPEALHGMARMLVDLPAGFLDGFLALRCPRTFVYGENNCPTDQTASADIPDPAKLRSGGVDIAIMPGTGHEMMLADPAAFARIVATWLAADC